jgi:hypothetical protein
MYVFFDGAFAVGYIIAAVFFLRFWRRTHEGLLLIFSIAFALMGLNYALLGLAGIPREQTGVLYVIRLFSFVMIIAGIAWTNVRRRS